MSLIQGALVVTLIGATVNVTRVSETMEGHGIVSSIFVFFMLVLVLVLNAEGYVL